MTIFDKGKFEELLQANWTRFLDTKKMLARVLNDTRDIHLPPIDLKPVSPSQTRITLSKFDFLDNGTFEIWVEFTVPSPEGTKIGSHIYHLTPKGFELKNTFGGVAKLLQTTE